MSGSPTHLLIKAPVIPMMCLQFFEHLQNIGAASKSSAVPEYDMWEGFNLDDSSSEGDLKSAVKNVIRVSALENA